MTYDDLVRIAEELPDTAGARGFGLQCVRRGDRMMFTLKKGGDTVAIKLDWDTRDRLLKESPDKYFLTRNYRHHPWLLARIALLDEEEARSLVSASWEDAPNPGEKRKWHGFPTRG
jgi:hypothetical protein